MKKLLLLVCLFCISFGFAQAQISLNINDLASPVQHFVSRNDTAPSVTPGNKGANIVWNFSALHATHDTLYMDVVNPNIIPMHSLFPAANLATIYDSAVSIYFFNRSASGLVMHGIVNDFLQNGDSIKMILSTPDTALALPAMYGDSAYRYSFGDTKSHCTYHYDTNFNGFPVSVPIDTIHIKHIQYKTDVIDAWGTVVIPNSIFPALRQKDITYSHDSLWGYANVPPPYQSYSGWYFITSRKDTTLTYTWWTKEYGIPAVKMTMATLNSNTVRAVEWGYNIPTTASIIENEPFTSAVYPNPANDIITITNTSGYNELVIYDVIGKEISRQSINNSDQVTVSVQNFVNGLYFYNIINAGTKTSGKFIVKH